MLRLFCLAMPLAHKVPRGPPFGGEGRVHVVFTKNKTTALGVFIFSFEGCRYLVLIDDQEALHQRLDFSEALLTNPKVKALENQLTC